MTIRTATTTDRRATRRLPGWAWFVLLWAGGVAGAVALGYAFKLFMNLTLFAVK
ncbi:hypothetical protein [Burkholderia guangdongensis]|uniref:hypothetical protein n=1 Tax=Burkholderia guangdongensis TaxID=1792500 RepID=UPI0015C6F71C|nr:hypothetical protein [Burkholderia guangdongensis]